jgi:GNAT superfamily N-acetyltransferase
VPTIALAETDAEIQRCFPVMAQLRTHLVAADFVARIRGLQQTAGFALASLADGGQVRSVAGFRISDTLYSGRYLYVDDLVTDAACRSAGHGAQLFDWLVDHAKSHNCEVLTLDSGVQRFAAHRFYLSRRMDILSHHFVLKLK